MLSQSADHSDCEMQGASSYLEASTTMNLVARSRHITNRSSSLEDIASGEKSEVEAEPKHWQESQPKTPVKSVSLVPSPLCPKPPTYLRPCPSPAVRRALMTDLSIGNSPKLRYFQYNLSKFQWFLLDFDVIWNYWACQGSCLTVVG